MIKTILKHKLIEFAIDTVFNGVFRNFGSIPNMLTRGMKLEYLSFTDKYNPLSIFTYLNVTITDVSPTRIAFTCGISNRLVYSTDERDIRSNFNQYKDYYTKNTRYTTDINEPNLYSCTADNEIISVNTWQEQDRYVLQAYKRCTVHYNTVSVPMNRYILKGFSENTVKLEKP
jgi:hypothetical protein